MAWGKFGALVSAALISVSIPTVASAALVNFNLTGSTPTNGAVGNVRTFTAGSGSSAVNVQVSAWTATKTGSGSNSSYSISKAYLGAYSHGLGVTTGSRDSHTVDNQGSFDFLVFHFDQVVEAEKATFFQYDYSDSDASINVGNIAGAFDANLNFANWAALTAAFGSEFTASSSGSATRNINSANETGNLLFVGASFTLDNNRGQYSYDGFKLTSLTVNTLPAVPEPATWAMMIAGFGLVGGAMRRHANVRVTYA